MTNRQLVYRLCEMNSVILWELAAEFELLLPSGIHQSSEAVSLILRWCDMQGQREHLRARVEEYV